MIQQIKFQIGGRKKIFIFLENAFEGWVSTVLVAITDKCICYIYRSNIVIRYLEVDKIIARPSRK